MLNHETIREQVSTYIREQILQMKLKPGERVIEQDLAEELAISRGPIREAMRQLEQEGLLEYRRNRGCIVKHFSREDNAEIFYLRSSLEICSVRYCGGNIPEELLWKMGDALEQMKSRIEKEGISGFVDQDQEFHSLIARACGLKRLYSLWDSLTPVNIVLFMTDNRKNFLLETQYDRHMQVLEALRSKDVELACQVIGNHYNKSAAL